MRLKFGFNRRLVLGAMVSAALVLGAAGCSSDANLTDAEHVERAKEHMDKGEFQSSVIQLKNALQKNPNNVEARWMLGQAYLDAGSGAQALKELERAGELGIAPEALRVPVTRALILQGETKKVIEDTADLGTLDGDAKATLIALRGDAFLAEGDIEKARIAYEDAIKIRPQTSQGQLGLARLAVYDNDFAHARELIVSMLKSAPRFADGWAFSGDLDRWEGKLKEASAGYSKAVEFSYGRPDFLFNRTLVRIALGEDEPAKKDIDRLARINPDHPGIFYARGLMQYKASHFAEAQTAFEGALAKAPDFEPALFYLGATHFERGQMQQAEQYLGRYVQASPSSPQGRNLLAVVRMRLKNLTGAEELLRPMLAKTDVDAVTLRLMGDIAYARNNPSDAIKYYQQSLEKDPSGTPRLQLGLSLLMQGEREQGLKELTIAADTNPGTDQADIQLILSHIRLKQFDQAITAADLAITRDPKNVVPLNLKALALALGRQQLKAKEVYLKVLSMSPGDPTAGLNLAAMLDSEGDLAGARKLVTEVVKHHPEHQRASLDLAGYEFRTGARDQAVKRVEALATKYPDAIDIQLALAQTYANVGRHRDALSYLESLRDKGQASVSFQVLYGQLLLLKGDLAGSIAAYQRASAISPGSPDVKVGLAEAYIAKRELTKARSELLSAVRQSPRHQGVLAALARLELSEGKVDDAAVAVKRYAETFPGDADAYLFAGLLAERNKQFDQAGKQYKEGLAKHPGAQFVLALARMEWAANRGSEGTALLADWYRKHPQDAEIGYQLANAYGRLGKRSEAEATLRNVVKNTPNHIFALNDLAWIERGKSRESALKYAARAAGLSRHPAVLDTYGVLLMENGQTDKAVEALSLAARTGGIPVVRYHYAMALAKKGDRAQARDVLNALLKEKVDYQERSEAQALLKSLQ